MNTHTLLRALLIGSLTGQVGCGNACENTLEDVCLGSKPADVTIGGRDVKVIPYEETRVIRVNIRDYILCEGPLFENCYSVDAYKEKLEKEVDHALSKTK